MIAARWRSWRARQEFFPGRFGLLVNPFARCRRDLWQHLRRHAGSMSGALIDVGCGSAPYRDLFPATSYAAADHPASMHRADIPVAPMVDGVLPFADAAFDSALCTQVLEHVFRPEPFLAEIHRVLRPGGHLLLTVPFAWNEHELPYDARRYTANGLRDLLARSGFHVLTLDKSTTGAHALGQLAAAMLVERMAGASRPRRWLIRVVIIFVQLAAGLAALAVRDESFYLDNVVLARRA